MKVAPENKVSIPFKTSRPETQESRCDQSRFRIEKVDENGQHGIAIGRVFISNNCNTILLVMALIFIVGGVILSAISYRPQDPDEDMQHYRERKNSEDASQSKIVGPICMVMGVVMLFFSGLFSTIFCLLQKAAQQQENLQRTISVVRKKKFGRSISRSLRALLKYLVEVMLCNVPLRMLITVY